MDKFFMVFVDGTPCANYRHSTEGEASKEAERLSLMNIGKKIYVLQMVNYCMTDKPKINWYS
jgi:hypothetical protein